MQLCSLRSAVEASFLPRATAPTKMVPPVGPRVLSSVVSVAALSPSVPQPPPTRPLVQAPSLLDQVTVRGITVTRADVARVAPVITFHPQERHHPCAIEELLAGACLKGANHETLVANPKSQDMGRYADSCNRLWLDARHASGTLVPTGHRLTAPMYVIVQVPESRAYVDVRYVMLFAYQGAQLVRVIVPSNDFDCFVPRFGEHQGDIENVCVRLTPDLKHVTHVTFEQHGKPDTQSASNVAFIDGHPLARCSLEDHATYNAQGLDPDARIEHVEEARKPVFGFGVGFIDLVSAHGARWAPHETAREEPSPFVFVGLDKDGKPINGQAWIGFAGSIGGCWRNTFTGAQGIDKSLSFMQRTYVNSLVKAVVASGKLEERRRVSNGTCGLSARSWLRLEP